MSSLPVPFARVRQLLVFGFVAATSVGAQPAQTTVPSPIPAIGYRALSLVTPTVLELTWINSKLPDPARVDTWDLIDAQGRFKNPGAADFQVTTDGSEVNVERLGFKRRVLYAPLKQRDLRIANSLYLVLSRPVAEHAIVTLKNRSGTLLPPGQVLSCTAAPDRLNAAIHVSQVGYLPGFPKHAMIGAYLGSLGELDLPAQMEFTLVDTRRQEVVFRGRCGPRPDIGFTFPCYRAVMMADFSEFRVPGEYRVCLPGLGVSYPVAINDGVAAALARTYALGLYHQRCGTANELPFTRFTHAPCHIAPAEVPTPEFAETQHFLAQETENFSRNPRHSAPPLKNVATSLYPFVRTGKIDVSGGHHDAGDYSKYTINSAGLIHHLVFAVDTFPGVGELDNLGLPESGDGKSDLLQEAKWEADFLARMQDDDGGFYFLVYPRNRRYENDVLPDRGDRQIVWPKTTAATAAAVAALAQTASSPLFRKQFPAAAGQYLAQARKGWLFLERARAKFGNDGAYQKITHYGDEFMHDDELAWAACELFLATGDQAYHRPLLDSFDPASPSTRRWTWWRMYECYGRAVRSYAHAVRSGRLAAAKLDPGFLARCETEIIKGAEDQLRRARQSAYGTSFPEETKRVRSAGWYFSSGQAFDLAAACQLDYPERNDPRPQFLAALIENLSYESGCNPVNVSYITGLGWRRQREIVHQYAQNDWRILPPSGIPLGNLQAGFGWMDAYKQELGALSFPPDGGSDNIFPIYDRWADSFNLQTEFVITDQARALAVTAFLMAQTALKNQPWKPVQASIVVSGNSSGRIARLEPFKDKSLPLDQAQIVWEVEDEEPTFGIDRKLSPAGARARQVEAEAVWPDGRRIFAATRSTNEEGAPPASRPVQTRK